MFWIGLVMALIGSLLTVTLSRDALKQRYASIKDYHLDSLSIAVMIIGFILSGIGHYRTEQTLVALQERTAPRHISMEQRKEMLPLLSTLKGINIAVACRMMDGESCDYATELASVFLEASCEVPELIKTSVNDLPGYAAITVYGKADISIANELYRAFSVAGVPAKMEAIKENSVGMWYPDTVHVIIGRKSP